MTCAVFLLGGEAASDTIFVINVTRPPPSFFLSSLKIIITARHTRNTHTEIIIIIKKHK